jgi:hypothetical protein
MTNGAQKQFLRLAGMILIPLLVMSVWAGWEGCGTGGQTLSSGRPAGPPAPPAELPSALRIPESLAIDVKTISSSGGSSALVVEGDNISEFIIDAATNALFIPKYVDTLLKPLHQLIIPVSPSVTSLQDVLLIGESFVEVKIDFSDFDEDGDGIREGCSGHTAALPICFRIWLDGKRHIEGVFDSFPTEDNAGSGRFRAIPEFGEFRKLGPFLLAGSYDRHDPSTSKSADIFLGFTMDPLDSPPTVPGSVSDLQETVHGALLQLGPDDSAVKQLNFSVDEKPSDADSATQRKELGRWREGNDLFSGSDKGPFAVGEPEQDFSAACAVITSGIVVNRQECLDAGIDVGVVGGDPDAVDFVDFLTLSDVIPSNFPESPTF